VAGGLSKDVGFLFCGNDRESRIIFGKVVCGMREDDFAYNTTRRNKLAITKKAPGFWRLFFAVSYILIREDICKCLAVVAIAPDKFSIIVTQRA